MSNLRYLKLNTWLSPKPCHPYKLSITIDFLTSLRPKTSSHPWLFSFFSHPTSDSLAVLFGSVFKWHSESDTFITFIATTVVQATIIASLDYKNSLMGFTASLLQAIFKWKVRVTLLNAIHSISLHCIQFSIGFLSLICIKIQIIKMT